MKKSFFLALAAVAMTASCTSGKGIIMKAPALAGDTIIVGGNVIPDFDKEFVDTVVVAADGSFHYNLPVKSGAVLQIMSQTGGEPLSLFLGASEKLEISANKAEDGTVSFEILTDGLNKGIRNFQEAGSEYDDAINQAVMAVQMAYATGAPEDTINARMDAYNKAIQDYSDFTVRYFLENADKPEAPYVILSAPIDSAESFVAALPAKSRNSVLQPMIEDRLSTLKEVRLKREAADNIKVGAMAPDFTLKDLNGNDLSLSSLKGKTVIVDFWGTWCGWCIKGIPDLKAAYEKYGDRLEILSIACRDTEKAWKEGVEKHGMQAWKHVIEAKDMETAAKPSVKYNISGFPTKLIISPEGEILNITVGEDPAFYEELDKIMK